MAVPLEREALAANAQLELENIELGLLLEAVYRQYGYDFREYAFSSLRRRVWRRVHEEQLGSITGLTDYVVNGRKFGVRIDIQPTNAPSTVVSLTHVRADPALTVGSAVVAATSKIGTVIDLSSVEREALARYTRDSGNHVSLEVREAASLASP